MKVYSQNLLKNLLVIIGCLMTNLVISQQFELVSNSPISTKANQSRSASFIDVNNDGHLDIFISNGKRGGENNQLFINQGDGTFAEDSNNLIVVDNKSSDGVTWGDVDNDGDLDVYVANWWDETNLFYLNNGKGEFSQQKTEAFLQTGYSETASWADYDKDGDLDLYVTNSSLDGLNNKNFFIKNNGDGRFTLEANQNITRDFKNSRNVSWTDIDNDGDLDLFIANESSTANQLFLNNNGSFTEVTSGDLVTSAKSSMGCSWADYDNDGDLDVFVTNLKEGNQLFNNQGNGNFQLVSSSTVGQTGSSFGSIWGDVDNDGDLDLFVANADFSGTKVSSFFYLNNGDGSFTKVTTGPVATYSGGTFGAAFGDYDNDGDLDLVTANTTDVAETNALYRNLGNANHWVNISLKGIMSNASAIGAKVKIKATIGGKSVWQMREVTSQSGYNCFSSLRVHFGLGDATNIDSLVIEWPLGLKETFTNVAIDKFHSYEEPITKSFLRANFRIGAIGSTTPPTNNAITYNIGENVQFVSTSVIDSTETVTYSWDFDNDGTEDANEKNPVFVFSKAGTYTVKLTIKNSVNESSITRTDYLTILDPSSISVPHRQDIKAYPTPFENSLQLNIKKEQLAQITLTDFSGRQAPLGSITANNRGVLVNNTQLKAGVYLLNIVLRNGQRQTLKVTKK